VFGPFNNFVFLFWRMQEEFDLNGAGDFNYTSNFNEEDVLPAACLRQTEPLPASRFKEDQSINPCIRQILHL